MADEDSGKKTEGGEGTGAVRTPPYISFQTFLTFLKELKTNGLPPQIDKSVMAKMSFGQQNQMKMALRSLGLMDGDKPTPRLRDLVNAHETASFDGLMLELMRETYPYVFALDLMEATPTMFAEAFKVTGAKEDVLRKCRTFFLHAAKKVGLPLGQRLLTGSVPRAPSNGAKRKPKKGKVSAQEDQGASTGETVKEGGNAALMEKLLEKFPAFDPKWPDEIKAKWFAGFDQFMASTKTAAGQ
jgi:hypothetical protein